MLSQFVQRRKNVELDCGNNCFRKKGRKNYFVFYFEPAM
jgi:hypothetical protein